jgi:hypothetical protein
MKGKGKGTVDMETNRNNFKEDRFKSLLFQNFL